MREELCLLTGPAHRMPLMISFTRSPSCRRITDQQQPLIVIGARQNACFNGAGRFRKNRSVNSPGRTLRRTSTFARIRLRLGQDLFRPHDFFRKTENAPSIQRGARSLANQTSLVTSPPWPCRRNRFSRSLQFCRRTSTS